MESERRVTGSRSSSAGHSVNLGRFWALAIGIGVVFLVYAIYLFSMQVVDGYIYELRAEQVTQRSVVISAPRGEIFDRNVDIPIVTNRNSFAIEIVPAEVPSEEREAVFERLAGYLNMEPGSIAELVPPQRYGSYQPIEVASGATFRTVTYLAEHKLDYPGVTWRIKPVRNYLDGDLFSHVLGYVGDITTEELQILFNEGYTPTALIGKAGVELEYDQLLRGEDGMRFRTVDAQGRRVADSRRPDIPPQQGMDLVLTVDRKIQELTKRALGERIGAAVVIRPATGEILSLVSYPSYNANRFYTGEGQDYFTELSLDPRRAFINRAIGAQASPASTFKVLMTTAVLEEDAFPVDQLVHCPGYRWYGNRRFACHATYGHGDLALYDALAQSCNVFFYTMGTDYLGVDTIVEYCRHYGLGERTGIDLPEENAGLVPTPEWKERVWNDGWRVGDTVNLSIGQGYLQITPIQLANMASLIVNRGVVYKPHILKEVRDPVTGEVVESVEPEVLRTVPISNETFEQLQDAMREVILSGTPEVIMTTTVPMGGKTGTTQTASEERQHSWFIGFAPYGSDNPDEQIAVAVWIDAANEWDWWGPYATNIIVHGAVNDLTYEETVDELRRLRSPWLWNGL